MSKHSSQPNKQAPVSTPRAASSAIPTATSAQTPRRRRFKDTRELDVLRNEVSYYSRKSGMSSPYSASRPISPSMDSLHLNGVYSIPQSPNGLGSPTNASQTSLLRSSNRPSDWTGTATPMSHFYGPSASALSESPISRVQVPEGMGVGVTESPYPVFAKSVESDTFAMGNSLRGPAFSNNQDMLRDAGVYGPAASSSPMQSMMDLPQTASQPEPRSLMQSWHSVDRASGPTSDISNTPQRSLSPSPMGGTSVPSSPSQSVSEPMGEQGRAPPSTSMPPRASGASVPSQARPAQAPTRSKSPLQQEVPLSPRPPPTTPSKGRGLFGWRRASAAPKPPQESQPVSAPSSDSRPPPPPTSTQPPPVRPSTSKATTAASAKPSVGEPKRKQGLFGFFKKGDKVPTQSAAPAAGPRAPSQSAPAHSAPSVPKGTPTPSNSDAPPPESAPLAAATQGSERPLPEPALETGATPRISEGSVAAPVAPEPLKPLNAPSLLSPTPSPTSPAVGAPASPAADTRTSPGASAPVSSATETRTSSGAGAPTSTATGTPALSTTGASAPYRAGTPALSTTDAPASAAGTSPSPGAGAPTFSATGTPALSTTGASAPYRAGTPTLSTAGAPASSVAAAPALSTAGAPASSATAAPALSMAGAPVSSVVRPPVWSLSAAAPTAPPKPVQEKPEPHTLPPSPIPSSAATMRPVTTSTTKTIPTSTSATNTPPIVDSISSWVSMSMLSPQQSSSPHFETRPSAKPAGLAQEMAPPTTATFPLSPRPSPAPMTPRTSDAPVDSSSFPAYLSPRTTMEETPRPVPAQDQGSAPMPSIYATSEHHVGKESLATTHLDPEESIASVHVDGEVFGGEGSSIHEPGLLRLSRSMQDMLRVSLQNPAVLGDIDSRDSSS